MPYRVIDFLPKDRLPSVRNVCEFAGVLALDKWVGNTDYRQAVFWRGSRSREYRAAFIDQGFCFRGNDWMFEDAPLLGFYRSLCVYRHIVGWDSFEPWLSNIESIDVSVIQGIAKDVPAEWYGRNAASLDMLLYKLAVRKSRVRELIGAFRDSDLRPFPNWRVSKAFVLNRGTPRSNFCMNH